MDKKEFDKRMVDASKDFDCIIEFYNRPDGVPKSVPVDPDWVVEKLFDVRFDQAVDIANRHAKKFKIKNWRIVQPLPNPEEVK